MIGHGGNLNFLLCNKRKLKVQRSQQRKERCQVKNQKEQKNDRLAQEVVAELDYLLKEGFLCLKNITEPCIVLSPGARI